MCPVGTYCPSGSTEAINCPDNTTTSNTGSRTISECYAKPGYYGYPGRAASGACPVGTYCESGSGPYKFQYQTPCPYNTTTSNTGSTNISQCYAKPGYYGSPGSIASVCPVGKYCPSGSTEAINCPDNTTTSNTGSRNISDCVY